MPLRTKALRPEYSRANEGVDFITAGLCCLEQVLQWSQSYSSLFQERNTLYADLLRVALSLKPQNG